MPPGFCWVNFHKFVYGLSCEPVIPASPTPTRGDPAGRECIANQNTAESDTRYVFILFDSRSKARLRKNASTSRRELRSDISTPQRFLRQVGNGRNGVASKHLTLASVNFLNRVVTSTRIIE